MKLRNLTFATSLIFATSAALLALTVSPPAEASSGEAHAVDGDARSEPHFGMDTADEYVVQPGDTLARISQDHLGSSEFWRHIAEANEIEDPKALAVGRTLRIPKRQADWFDE